MTKIVLYMTVNGEDFALITKFSVPPAVSTTVRVLTPESNYSIRHRVEQVFADPFDGNYYVILHNRVTEHASHQAAEFCKMLQSAGWKKV